MAPIDQQHWAAGTHYLNPGGPIMIFMTLCALCLALLPNLACGNQAAPNSGIEGQVSIGPISPVSRPGEVNSKPYMADILFRRVSDNHVVADVRSGKGGAFHVALEPGRYLIEPQQGNPLPIASSQEVTVVAGQFTRIQIDYDSGIR